LLKKTGKDKATKYGTLVENMLETFRNKRCQMSQLHFHRSHLDFFLPSNLGDVSDEQGDRVHKYISIMEKCYKVTLTNYS